MRQFRNILWLVCMAILSIGLYTVIYERGEIQSDDVILGGEDSVYVGASSISYADPNYVEEVDDGLDWPDIDISLQQYQLVTNDNPLSSAFTPDLAYKEDGVTFDPIWGTRYQAFAASAKPYLDEMLQDMTELGFTPYIAASYRTYSYQSNLFNQKTTAIFMEMGYSASDWDKYYEEYTLAAEQAAAITAKPGGSEHQLGMAVDIWDKERTKVGDYTNMDEDFRNWLEEHAWEYGFIQRYPTNKLLRTGWDEPWHYRYVGVDVAKFIKETGMCYEEFYAHYSDYSA